MYIKSAFAWFIGVSSLVLFFPLTFLVWLIALPFDRERKIIHYMLVCQSKMVNFLIPVWKVNIKGIKNFEKNSTYIIISNHQSLLDILIINSLCYSFKWVSKAENIRVPILGWYLWMADYLVVDRNNEESKAELLARAYRFLKKGISVMIFPEGTRYPDLPGYFKRGAFSLAIEAKVPVLPIVIDGTGSILPKKSLIIRKKRTINLHVLDPVPPEAFGTDDPDMLALKFRELITSELSKIRIQDGTQS
jgi:1-acyl-sn-glycerol-3-phosphate acyltransferase